MRLIVKEVIKNFVSQPDSTPFYIQMTGTSYCDGSYRIRRDYRDLYVLEYIVQGEGVLRVDNRQYTPKEGDVYILHKGIAHEYFSSAENPWIKMFMNIKGSLCRTVFDEYGLGNINLIENCNVKKQFEEFLEIANREQLSDHHIFNQCAGKFVEIVAELSGHEAKLTKSYSIEAVRLKEYLDKNTGQLISNQQLSEQIYRSQDYTLKLFKREFGITPYDYQIHQKMDISRKLLLNTNMSIREVAGSVGYTDQHYFSNLFYKKCGIRPSDYRKNEQKCAPNTLESKIAK